MDNELELLVQLVGINMSFNYIAAPGEETGMSLLCLLL